MWRLFLSRNIEDGSARAVPGAGDGGGVGLEACLAAGGEYVPSARGGGYPFLVAAAAAQWACLLAVGALSSVSQTAALMMRRARHSPATAPQ
jgi:hypothetical protein